MEFCYNLRYDYSNSLEKISYKERVVYLCFSDTDLTELNLSQFSQLEELDCSKSDLIILDLSHCPLLTILQVSSRLKQIIIVKNEELCLMAKKCVCCNKKCIQNYINTFVCSNCFTVQK